MSKTDEERIAIREQMLQRLWDDANYGDKKILTFDPQRYGNIIINLGDGEPQSIALYVFAEKMMDDDILRDAYLELSDRLRANL